MSKTQSRPVAVDLFCGAGGLTLGLLEAGFDVVLGVDCDRNALATYEANFGHRALQADITKLSGQDVLRAAATGEIDLLAGGPSCQGFSTHGKRRAEDERNFLYREYLRLVREISPRFVLLENVKGLLSTRNGDFKHRLLGGFARLGYTVELRTLLAADYGVPQLRERVIFLAARHGEPIRFPEPSHAAQGALLSSALKPYVTVEDAIGDLPAPAWAAGSTVVGYRRAPRNEFQELMRRDSSGILYNHVAKPVSPYAFQIIKRIKPGQGLRSLPLRYLPDRFKRMRRISTGELRRDCTTLYYRLSPEKPAYTITCYFTNVSAGAFTHPSEHRAITHREAARLQSFPDSFVFVGSSIAKQIGNAVPPLMGKAIGEAILRVASTVPRRVA